MIIVDADVHVSATAGEGEIEVQDLVRLLDENEVDKAIAWPMLTYTREVSQDNKAIAEGMRKYPDRIIGFGGLNPCLGMEKTLEEFRQCVEEYGIKGFKLNGARDGYIIDNKNLTFPIFERIVEANLMVALHSGMNDPVRTHPWRIGNIAEGFPELKILMVHMGGVGVPGLHDAAIKIAQKYPNIYLVDSEVYRPRNILRAIDTPGAERVCYGSDEPFYPMKLALAMNKKLVEGLSEEEQKLVMGENILRILSLHSTLTVKAKKRAF